MKKLFPLLIAFTLLFSFPLPTFAAESNDRQQNTSFEISLEEALALADPADITVQNGITTIPVKLDILFFPALCMYEMCIVLQLLKIE